MVMQISVADLDLELRGRPGFFLFLLALSAFLPSAIFLPKRRGEEGGGRA